MFDSLSDRIKADEQVANTERFIRWAVVALISVAMFGGLYFGVRLLEG